MPPWPLMILPSLGRAKASGRPSRPSSEAPATASRVPRPLLPRRRVPSLVTFQHPVAWFQTSA